MPISKLLVVLVLVIAPRLCAAVLQDGPSSSTSNDQVSRIFRERRARAMQGVPNGLLLVRSRSSAMADNQDGFRQDAAFYYLTGLENAGGALLLLDSRRQESWLFVPPPGQLRRFGGLMHPPYGYVEVGKASAERLGLDHVVFWDEFATVVDRRLAEDPALVILGPFSSGAFSIPSGALTGQNEVRLWESALRAHWPKAQFAPMPDPINLRAIKDATEIAALRRVAESSSAALRAGLAALRPGRRQRDAEVDVVAACVRAGAEGVSFWPWLMTGPNSDITMAIQSLADYRFLDRTMRAGELARVDVGCSQDHYEGDVGRTAPVNGRFDPGQREAWDMFVAAYRSGLDNIKPGVTAKEVLAAWQGEFQKRQPHLRTSFGKRTAEVALSAEGAKFWQMHGVGLQNAEGLIEMLAAGQVLAFEPILTVDGVGLYLEDMILVTPAGAEVLTKGLPYTSLEIEAAMRRRR